MITNDEMIKLALEASKNAYVPYSKFHVGACAVYESGNVYQGCNVENASYGLTLCAERNTISSAIAAGEKTKLLKIAIASPDTKLCWPCGACLQWIYEFEDGQHTKVLLEKEDSSSIQYCINELLPHIFQLKK
ncbi:MAG: cytidine deaminase [Candidatus Gastranaerophilales bacterium]|nr:cytidine deaminase [Candidatus Gastranaerophilales bacterium]